VELIGDADDISAGVFWFGVVWIWWHVDDMVSVVVEDL